MSDITFIKNKEALKILGYKSHKTLYKLEQEGMLTALRHPYYKQRAWDKEEVILVAKDLKRDWK